MTGTIRRFEPGASADPWQVALYLIDKGHKIHMRGQWFVVDGQRRKLAGILSMADTYRRQEGKEPFRRMK